MLQNSGTCVSDCVNLGTQFDHEKRNKKGKNNTIASQRASNNCITMNLKYIYFCLFINPPPPLKTTTNLAYKGNFHLQAIHKNS